MDREKIAIDLLQLAAQLKPWQQDAMRRLASSDTLKEEDEDELLRMIKKDAGIPIATEPPNPISIAKEHLTAAGAPKLTLAGVRNIKNVNRLDDHAHVEFRPEGLTAVFGLNATGKTGYIRILRSACHGQNGNPDRLRVLSDVYGDSSSLPREAEVICETPDGKITIPWVDGDTANPKLANIRVFDNAAADVYVDKENRLQHLPFGLKIPYQLNELCLKLREHRLKTERSEKQIALNSVTIAPLPAEETKARVFFDRMSATTSDGTINSASSFTEDSSTRLKQIRQIVAGSAGEIADLKILAQWCRKRNEQLMELRDALSIGQIDTLIKLHQEAATAREAADAAARESFGAEPLKGIGSEHWRVLWQVAREYSQEWAYSDQSYPVVHDHEGNPANCVLCQQPLQEPAQSRMQRFEDFVTGAAAKHADTIEAKATIARSIFNSLELSLSDDDKKRLDQLEARFPDLANIVSDWYAAARARWAAVDRTITTGQEIPLPEFAGDPSADLPIQAANLERLAKEREEALTPEERGKLEAEQLELEGRETLSKAKNALMRRRDLMKTVAAYDAAISSIDTRPITTRIKPLIDKYVTQRMKERFQVELQNLKMAHLPIGLRDESDRESAKYKTDLGSTRIRRSSEILSEGEQRALALAAFLTEASVSTPGAPIIIDDPVSSLDHERLDNVAERLVQEAQHRQVIVFTHSLEFLYDLENCIEKAGSPFMVRTIFRTDDGRTGQLNPSPLPWKGQKIKSRINVIRDTLMRIKKTRNEAPDEYEIGARQVYTLLRETYERFVEEILFHDVIRRYSPDVRTQQLRYVTVSNQIAERFHKGYDKTCEYSHDNPRGSPVAPPDPVEIEQDLDNFEALVNDTRAAQKIAESNRPSMKP